MRCPLRFLTHFLNARHTQKCIPAQSRCLFIASPQRLNEFQCKPSAEANLFGYAKAQPEIMKSEALNNYRITIHSGTLIFLLRLGIINAGHFDKLSDRIASALAAQETRQAQ
jgi:hypothetical protein